MTKKSTVAVVRCPNYNSSVVKEALIEALKPLGGLSVYIAPKDKVLIKPNLIRGAKPEKAIIPHLELLRALIGMLNEIGAEVYVGDSPGIETPEYALETSGYMTIMNEMGAKQADFYREIDIDVPEGGLSKKVRVVRAIREADKIINLSKMKTHGFMMFSGAVKNMFGIVSGVAKVHAHIRFPSPDLFAQGLLDIYSAAKPTLNIMDAVVSMEGDGPTNGHPRKMGLLLASDDGVALDVVACSIIGISPASVATTAVAARRGIGAVDLSSINIEGVSIDDVRVTDYEIPGSWKGITSHFAKTRFMRSIGSVKPRIIHKTCRKCGKCIKGCPAQSMRMVRGKVKIDHAKCIKCYCCQEHCPYNSVKLKSPIFAKILLGFSHARDLRNRRIEDDWR